MTVEGCLTSLPLRRGIIIAYPCSVRGTESLPPTLSAGSGPVPCMDGETLTLLSCVIVSLRSAASEASGVLAEMAHALPQPSLPLASSPVCLLVPSTRTASGECGRIPRGPGVSQVLAIRAPSRLPPSRRASCQLF